MNDIARYLSGFYPQTARRVLKEMREKITKLGDTPRMCEVYALDPTYRKLVADQYLVFYHVNENVKVVEIHRVLRGSWNLPQYLEENKEQSAPASWPDALLFLMQYSENSELTSHTQRCIRSRTLPAAS